MAYWKVMSKTPNLENADISHFIKGIPGPSKWVYNLANESTNELIMALATEDYEIGKIIHDGDLIKVL